MLCFGSANVTEAEILELVAITIDRVWMIAQWWVSISLALIAVAHVAAKRINLPILIGMMAMYFCYTAMVVSFYVWNSLYMLHLADELHALTTVTRSNRAWDHPSGTAGMMFMNLSGVLLYLACNAYLIRTYIQERRET